VVDGCYFFDVGQIFINGLRRVSHNPHVMLYNFNGFVWYFKFICGLLRLFFLFLESGLQLVGILKGDGAGNRYGCGQRNCHKNHQTNDRGENKSLFSMGNLEIQMFSGLKMERLVRFRGAQSL
jgi:hypothetical protein